jgi:hypothetical protein
MAFFPVSCRVRYSIVWYGRTDRLVTLLCDSVAGAMLYVVAIATFCLEGFVYSEPSFSSSCTDKDSVGASSAAFRSHASFGQALPVLNPQTSPLYAHLMGPTSANLMGYCLLQVRKCIQVCSFSFLPLDLADAGISCLERFRRDAHILLAPWILGFINT